MRTCSSPLVCARADGCDHPSPAHPLTREAEDRQPGLHPCAQPSQHCRAPRSLESGDKGEVGTRKESRPSPSCNTPPQTGHQPPLTTDAPALTPSRNGFILEPRCFIKNTDLPKPAQISLLSGGSVKHSTVRDAPEETGGLQRRAKSEASGMMQPWCSEIAGL